MSFKHWKCLWNISNVYCGAHYFNVTASTLLKMYSITKDLLTTSRNWKCNFSNKIMTDKGAVWLNLKGIFQRILPNFKFQSFKNWLHQRRFTKKNSKFHILVLVHMRTFISKHRIKLVGCISVGACCHVPVLETVYVQ